MDISKFLSQILSTTWFFQPQQLLAYGTFLKGLTDGTFAYFEESKKAPIQAFAITPSGEILMVFDEEEDSDDKKPDSIFDNYPEGSILIIPLEGVMFKEDTWWSWGTETISRLIREAADHDNISAIIKKVNSGGGSVSSIPPMIDATNYAKAKKPVLSWVDTAASAAYYSISPDDLIIASNDLSSEFGSIGVMVNFWDIAPYWEKMGLKEHTIYAPESNYKNLPFENALNGDYKLMKEEVLSPLAKKFQADVRMYRGGKVNLQQKGILNGKMFYANDAIKFGLADELGNLEYAIKRANELAAKQ